MNLQNYVWTAGQDDIWLVCRDRVYRGNGYPDVPTMIADVRSQNAALVAQYGATFAAMPTGTIIVLPILSQS